MTQPTEEMVEAIARRRFERATPHAPKTTWDWLPQAAKRQWLLDAEEDLEAAFAVIRREGNL